MIQRNDSEVIDLAARFLATRDEPFVVDTGKILTNTAEGKVVAFLVPEALESGCVVDLPDLRVLVKDSGELEFIPQM